MSETRKVVVGITGASGTIFAVKALEAMARAGIETHVVISKWGMQTTQHETGLSQAEVRALCGTLYNPNSLGAAISSGSFRVDSMVIVPCSMKTLSAIAQGYSDNLVHRAADVIIKERLPLVLVPRETPLNPIHLENMLKLARMGIAIVPPMPSFYNNPTTIDDLVDYFIARLLDQLQIQTRAEGRWDGKMQTPRSVPKGNSE